MRKYHLLPLAVIVTTAIFLLIPTSKASALSGSDFQAGRIIDDGVFFNGSAMDAGSIQSLLNAKVPTCDTSGTQPYGGTTRAAYGASKGYPAPYICLKNYTENTPTKVAEAGLCNQYSGGVKTGAQIIADVGYSCGVSPKVLIILLEKEQSLVTDDWPWSIQYRSATGYGCPDTAACDSTYYGFFNQVYNAARQFKRYGRDSTTYGYRALRTNYIQYHPNAACGGSNIYIQNQATAGLYNYTPYQPNPSVLANLYGLGDSCGAYGNRNFWRMFNDWFGSTFADIYSSNVSWKFEELDGSGTSVNQNPSGNLGYGVATVQDGPMLHTFYHDYASGDLKHSWADQNGWHFETLDGNGALPGSTNNNVGKFVKASLINNKIYVLYYDQTKGDVRLATWDSTLPGWTLETLDGSGGGTGKIDADVGQDLSLIGYGTSVQVFYSDVTNGNLRHAWLTGNSWSLENLDGSTDSVSQTEGRTGQNIAATLHGNSIQLYYYDSNHTNIKHAWADNRGWHFEHLDGDRNAISRTEGNVGAYIGAASYGGTLQVFYYDADRGNLKHAWADNRGWHFEHLDGDRNAISRTEGNVGARPVVFGFNGKLYIFYSNPEQGILRQAWASSTGWGFAEIDGSYVSVSRNGSHPLSGFISVTPFGNDIQAFYYDSYTGILRHAWGTPQ